MLERLIYPKTYGGSPHDTNQTCDLPCAPDATNGAGSKGLVMNPGSVDCLHISFGTFYFHALL